MAYIANGQLSGAPAVAIVTANNVNPGNVSAVTIRLYNNSGANQNVVVTWTHGTTTTNLYKASLFGGANGGDGVTLQNIMMAPGDTINANCSTANGVDYNVWECTSGPFMVYTYDQYGSIKNSSGGSGV